MGKLDNRLDQLKHAQELLNKSQRQVPSPKVLRLDNAPQQ